MRSQCFWSIAEIDAVFLSHLHLDHYDDAAKELLPKGIKVFVQDEADKGQVETAGFTNAEILTETTTFEGIALSKTKAQHGRGEILTAQARCAASSGIDLLRIENDHLVEVRLFSSDRDAEDAFWGR